MSEGRGLRQSRTRFQQRALSKLCGGSLRDNSPAVADELWARKSLVRLALIVAMCLGVGIMGSLVTRPEIPTWYADIIKPSWTPPSLVFPIAWTALYILMAISLWRLWENEPRSAARSNAIVWFLAQLVLNAAWSAIFFSWHGTKTALVIIVALLLAIGVTIIFASRVDRVAAYLLVPYLAWVAYATTINAGVVALN